MLATPFSFLKYSYRWFGCRDDGCCFYFKSFSHSLELLLVFSPSADNFNYILLNSLVSRSFNSWFSSACTWTKTNKQKKTTYLSVILFFILLSSFSRFFFLSNEFERVILILIYTTKSNVRRVFYCCCWYNYIGYISSLVYF